MRCCDKHWSMMRQAVEDRGMTHLIKTAQENVEAAKDQFNNNRGPVADEYDPLMSMWWMVAGRAIQMGGMYLMQPGEEFCPVCEAIENLTGVPGLKIDGVDVESTGENVEKSWIHGPADAAFEECVRLGLIQRT